MNFKDGEIILKIGIISLGCSKNLINTEQMMYLLLQEGFEIAEYAENDEFDLVLLNTCGFIESAKSEAIETIIDLGERKQQGGFKKLVVAGCLSERYKKEILAELPEIDAVLGTGAFDEIVGVVKKVMQSSVHSTIDDVPQASETTIMTDENLEIIRQYGKLAFFGDIHAPVSEVDRVITTSPTWAYLKIAEGCDNNCAYCVIPSIRGKFRSRPMQNIVSEAQSLVAKGVRELIIVAQDVTKYGVDLYNSNMLVTLLDELCYINELRWIRLHYLYPDEINDILIDFISSRDKILKYLDIPIQHINDKILAKMNRRGTGKDIRGLIANIRKRMPNVVLRTSIITGLPGEGEREFSQLCEFLLEAKIERAGIFQYSPEEGSVAAEMDYPDAEVAAERVRVLTDLQSDIMDEFDLSRVGSVETVLIEGLDEDGNYYGRSFAESPDVDGYIKVEGTDIQVHEFVEVRIVGVTDGGLLGAKVKEVGL